MLNSIPFILPYIYLVVFFFFSIYKFILLLLFSFSDTSVAHGNSWARDQIRATAVNYTTAMAMQILNLLRQAGVIEPAPLQRQLCILNLLHHSGNS